MAEENFENGMQKESVDIEQIVIEEISNIQSMIDDARNKVKQSQIDVDEVSRQNEKINMELQQLISKEDTSLNSALIDKFNDALSFQQRLINMRGQYENLKNQQEQMLNFQETFEKLIVGFKQNKMLLEEEKAENIVSAELLIETQEIERRKLSRKIHDGPAQSLSNFIMQAEIVSHLLNKDPEKAKQEIVNLKTSASKTFQQVRDFIFMLRPMMLDDLGIVATIKKYCEVYSEKMNTEIDVTVSGNEQRYENFIEVIIFRSAQMFLENALAQAKASNVSVQIDVSEHQIRMIIDDNRKVKDNISEEKVILEKIKSIKKQIEMLGGTILVSPTTGEGVNILLDLPILSGEF